jgi:flagellum-specific peptidoglycan hydrolase FlgJ
MGEGESMKQTTKQSVKTILVILIISVLTVTNGAQFLSYHELQSPVIPHVEISFKFQLPFREKKLLSPLASQSARVNPFKAYAAELPDYRESDYYKSSSPKWKEFVTAAYELAPIYDYPTSVLLSQAALESAHGTSRMAIQRNNFFGWNCTDGNEEQNCTYFDNPKEAIIEYMRGIKRSGIYDAAYAVRTNPVEMIVAIKNAGYASDPRYITKVMSQPEWGTK